MEEIKKNYIVICDKEEKLQLCEIFTKKGWKVCSDFNSKKPKRPFSCWFEVKTRQIWQEEYFSAEEITAKEFISRFGPEEESDGFKVGDQFKNKRTREIIELTDVTNLNDIFSKTIKGSMDYYLWSRNYLIDNFEKIKEKKEPETKLKVGDEVRCIKSTIGHSNGAGWEEGLIFTITREEIYEDENIYWGEKDIVSGCGVYRNSLELVTESSTNKFRAGDKVRNKETGRKDVVESVLGTEEYNSRNYMFEAEKGMCLKDEGWDYQDDWEKIEEIQPKTATEVMMEEQNFRFSKETLEPATEPTASVTFKVGETVPVNCSGVTLDLVDEDELEDDFEDLSAPNLFEKGLEKFDRGVKKEGDSFWF